MQSENQCQTVILICTLSLTTLLGVIPTTVGQVTSQGDFSIPNLVVNKINLSLKEIDIEIQPYAVINGTFVMVGWGPWREGWTFWGYGKPMPDSPPWHEYNPGKMQMKNLKLRTIVRGFPTVFDVNPFPFEAYTAEMVFGFNASDMMVSRGITQRSGVSPDLEQSGMWNVTVAVEPTSATSLAKWPDSAGTIKSQHLKSFFKVTITLDHLPAYAWKMLVPSWGPLIFLSTLFVVQFIVLRRRLNRGDHVAMFIGASVFALGQALAMREVTPPELTLPEALTFLLTMAYVLALTVVISGAETGTYRTNSQGPGSVKSRSCEMSKESIEIGKKMAAEVAAILRQVSDPEAGELLGTGVMDDLLKAILDPKKVKDYPSIAEFLLANKRRAQLLAFMRYAITRNYSFKAGQPGKEGFVSPHFAQWFEDGVMFLEGQEPFAGLIGLYRNKEARYATAARDARSGEELGPQDFEFVTIEDLKARIKSVPVGEIGELEKPIHELKQLINTNTGDESKYQVLIEKYPWILGAQYESVQDHRKLDDRNVPDFTGVRSWDKYRDIIEIKSPFIPIFRKDGEFTSGFNLAWNKAERYLNFAREDKDYLRRKGLNFDNPKCYLIVGSGIPDADRSRIRTKERLNPAITVLTYDDLIVLAEKTVRFVNELKRAASPKDAR